MFWGFAPILFYMLICENDEFDRNCVYQLGSVQSLLPLHNTVANCRMVSNLSIDSRNCHDVSQVTLSCNHPGP